MLNFYLAFEKHDLFGFAFSLNHHKQIYKYLFNVDLFSTFGCV